MMMGVAQVMGIKPTLSLLFSSLPLPCAKASLMEAKGRIAPTAAIAVGAPTACRKLRRTLSTGNRARITACSTTLEERASLLRASALLIDASCSASEACWPQLQRRRVLESNGFEKIDMVRASNGQGHPHLAESMPRTFRLAPTRGGPDPRHETIQKTARRTRVIASSCTTKVRRAPGSPPRDRDPEDHLPEQRLHFLALTVGG